MYMNFQQNEIDEIVDENGDNIVVEDTNGNMVVVNDLGEMNNNGNIILNDGEIVEIPPTRMRHNIDDMSFEELKKYSKKLLENKKKYIRKYQKTDKGKQKIREASKRYYEKNRQKILDKKKQYYLDKKKNSA